MPGLPESTRLATPSGHPESGRAVSAITVAGTSRYSMQLIEHGQYHYGADAGLRNRIAPRPDTCGEPPSWPNAAHIGSLSLPVTRSANGTPSALGKCQRPGRLRDVSWTGFHQCSSGAVYGRGWSQ